MAVLRTILFTVFSVFFIQSNARAQEDVTIVTGDLETWSRIGLDLKLNKKWSMGIDQQLRLKHNSSLIDQILTDIDVKYKLSKQFYFGAAIRYIADRKSDLSYDNDFRYNFDLGYKHKMDRFSLDYRLRYQNKNEIGLSKALGDEAIHGLRFRLNAEYDFKDWKLDPYFSTEIFSDPSHFRDGLSKARFTLGTDYSIIKSGKLGVFYRIEREIGETYPKTTYIVGAKFTYTIKNKSDK
ncbi:DUF2490 domain-containing protein [Crocinitomix catalasitica]|uniref:DUF2490 domain-containing protein n=1 Tax=Crocinitomix catalasitica TaxID=184607 RepID=UPI000485C094|nr:DUF2490 domain-containing protein [Crocinitomix catalasitica]